MTPGHLNHARSRCADCGVDVYRNLHPQAGVKIWVHDNGGKFCDLTERTTACPVAVAV